VQHQVHTPIHLREIPHLLLLLLLLLEVPQRPITTCEGGCM
jgi:hypothetical protein